MCLFGTRVGGTRVKVVTFNLVGLTEISCNHKSRNYWIKKFSGFFSRKDGEFVLFLNNWVDKENRKTCAFTFQNMCFQISDIGKHVIWHRILYWEWEEDVCPANCQKNLSGAVAPPLLRYESMKRKLLKPIYECRCNGRLVVVVWLFIGTQNRLVALHSALFPRLT